MKVIGYLRVSTREQANGGHGLDAQRAAIRDEAKRQDWRVRWIEDAGYTGSHMRRDGLTEALALLDAGEAEKLVVAKLDRLSRSVRDFADMVERARRGGWDIVLLDLQLDTSTPMGEAMANVAVTFAQLERRLISQRTKEGLAAARAKGIRLGAPKGRGRAHIEPHVEARIARESANGASLREIAAALQSDGVPTGLGGRWHASTVASILKRLDTKQ